MSRKKISVCISAAPRFDGKVVDVIKMLQDIAQQHPGAKIVKDYTEYDDDHGIRYEIVDYREETDEEVTKRVAEYTKNLDESEERALFESLKSKFEPK